MDYGMVRFFLQRILWISLYSTLRSTVLHSKDVYAFAVEYAQLICCGVSKLYR